MCAERHWCKAAFPGGEETAMKSRYVIAGLVVVGAGLVGWGALAWGQTQTNQGLAVAPTQPGDTGTIIVLPPRGQSPYTSLAPATTRPSIPPPSPRLNNVVVGSGQPTGSAAAPSPHGPQNGPALSPSEATKPRPSPSEAGPEPAGENGTNRQEQAVTLEWVGPTSAKIHQTCDYGLVVRNACGNPVQQVLVRVKIPNGMNILSTEPKAVSESNLLVWELGMLSPRQEKTLQMRLQAETRGEAAPQAWVTFTGSSSLRIKIREPKLVLKAQATEKVLLGDAATIVFTVTNPGDGSAEQVKIHAELADGLEHKSGKRVDYVVGTLAPGESRSATLVCATKSIGQHSCEGYAEAEGGLTAKEQVAVSVQTPRLDVLASGPAIRYLERRAVYTFRAVNPGDAPATNVTLTDSVPEGFKFLAASEGGQHDANNRSVSWFLGEIAPGQAKEVRLELLPIALGDLKQQVIVQAARGLKAQSEVKTHVEGLSAILTEVVDTDDPIEVGAETVYEVRISNTGSKAETDLKLVCTIPDKMEFKTAQGPAHFKAEGKQVIFDPLPKLAPRADALFRITVKGIAPGDVRFKVEVTSANLVDPIIRMESTRIYSDAPEKQ
jgi:uncharacterized repeat protein (TIGR01451 family)